MTARHFRLASPATATALGVLVLILLGATVTLAAFDHQATFLDIATGVPIPLVYAAVGVIVARHQPRNPVGWILILFVVLFLIWVDAGLYAVLRYHLGHHGLPLGPAAVVLTSLWPLAFALFPLVILLLPDGRLTSRRWRWVLRGYAVAVGYVVAVNLVPALAAEAAHSIQVNSSGDRPVRTRTKAGPAGRGPPVQPGPLRRRPSHHRVHGPAAGHGGPGGGPQRPGRRHARRPRTRPPISLDQAALMR